MSNSSAACMTDNHALVLSASGICGWAIVNALLHDYPTSESFHRVTALTNRPLDPDVTLWPPSSKLQHVSGVDLLQGSQADLEQKLKENITSIESVTVVYFMAYCFHEDAKKEVEQNTVMLERVVTAMDHLSPRLTFVVLTLGVKQYGVHLLDQFPWRNKLPLREDHPPIPEPHLSDLFYTHQLNFLTSASAHKQWTFCTLWPDIIIGYVPTTTFYCLSQNVAVYLSLYREINGAGAEVVFPGTNCWTVKSNDSSQDTIARFAIHASLHPELSADQGFNTADNASWSTWSVKWPIICDYFGLKGVPPADGEQGQQLGPDPDDFVAENQDRWVDMEKQYELRGGLVKGKSRGVQGICHFLMDRFDYDRQLDLTKMHHVWGKNTEEKDTKEAWYVAFDRFRKAKMIP